MAYLQLLRRLPGMNTTCHLVPLPAGRLEDLGLLCVSPRERGDHPG